MAVEITASKNMLKAKVTTCVFIILSLISGRECEPYTLKEVEVKSDQPIRIFTFLDMKQYDGSDDAKPIYIGLKGVVFDVSEGRDFYGKGAPYNSLVGMDSTRACALMSLDEENLTHDITGLEPSSLESLDSVFTSTYMAKYPVVGYMQYLVDQQPHSFKGLTLAKGEL